MREPVAQAKLRGPCAGSRPPSAPPAAPRCWSPRALSTFAGSTATSCCPGTTPGRPRGYPMYALPPPCAVSCCSLWHGRSVAVWRDRNLPDGCVSRWLSCSGSPPPRWFSASRNTGRPIGGRSSSSSYSGVRIRDSGGCCCLRARPFSAPRTGAPRTRSTPGATAPRATREHPIQSCSRSSFPASRSRSATRSRTRRRSRRTWERTWAFKSWASKPMMWPSPKETIGW